MYTEKKKFKLSRRGNKDGGRDDESYNSDKKPEYINEDPNENEPSHRMSESDNNNINNINEVHNEDELDNINDVDKFDTNHELIDDHVNYENIDHNFLQTKRKIRQRSMADGAVKLNVDLEDMVTDNIDVYDGQDMNFEFIFGEDAGDNYQIYVESLKSQKYLVVPQQLAKPKIGHAKISEYEKEKLRPKVTKDKNILFVLEDSDYPKVEKLKPEKKEKKEEPKLVKEKKIEKKFNKETEKSVFNKFDADLTFQIGAIATRISKYFLVIEGVLAGNS